MYSKTSKKNFLSFFFFFFFCFSLFELSGKKIFCVLFSLKKIFCLRPFPKKFFCFSFLAKKIFWVRKKTITPPLKLNGRSLIQCNMQIFVAIFWQFISLSYLYVVFNLGVISTAYIIPSLNFFQDSVILIHIRKNYNKPHHIFYD